MAWITDREMQNEVPDLYTNHKFTSTSQNTIYGFNVLKGGK